MKVKINVLVVVFFAITMTVFAGNAIKEGNIWYFGKFVGIDFNFNPPSLLTDGKLDNQEGCATISDKDGKLLFYTDGQRIFDKTHELMQNGDSLMGHWSSTQSAIIVPKPGNRNLYYVFTVSDKTLNVGFRYSVVDMTLNNGYGAVTDKNIMLHPTCAEKVTAVSHSNGVDVWVIMKDWNNNEFRSYLISTDGLAGIDNNRTGYPVVSKTGLVHSGDSLNRIGYMKASPDGSKICLTVYKAGFSELFDFNNATGELKSKVAFTGPAFALGYGVEFSPDATKLYLSYIDSPSYIYQFDVTKQDPADILASMDTVAISKYQMLSALQLAPDGKIYIAVYGTSYIASLDFPNKISDSCKFNWYGFDLKGRYCYFGLPTFISTFFLDFSGKNIYMGKIVAETVKDSVVKKFVENTGDDPFTVKSMSLNGGNSDQFELLSQITSQVVNPGEFIDINVRFKPTSPGFKRTSIVVEFDSASVSYALTGEAIEKPGPLMSFDIDMGKVIVDNSKDSLIKAYISNIDNKPVTLNEIIFTGTSASQFSTVNFNGPIELQAGEKIDVFFKFSPSSPGQKTAQVNIYGDRDTIYHSITGLGIDKGNVLGAIDVDMGKVIVTTSKDSVVTGFIRNLTNLNIQVDSMIITGANKSDFSIISGLPPYTLISEQTKDVGFNFAPKTKGYKSAIIEIYGADTVIKKSIRGEGIKEIEDTSGCDETYFSYTDFSNTTKLKFAGKANKYNNYLRLTSSINHLVGAAWYFQQIPIRNGFTTEFKFRFSEGFNDNAEDNSQPGADGIAFVIQNSGPGAIGLYGGGIGYDQIKNSLAIEFDTYSNDAKQIENYFDPNGNHIAVQSNGRNENSSKHKETYTLGMADSIPEIRANNTTYYVRIDYNILPNQLRIYMDKTGDFIEPVLVVNDLEIDKLLDLLYGEGAYVGFTSATGSARENHDIISWTFCPKPSSGQLTNAEETVADFSGTQNIYPNPFNEKLNIRVNSNPGDDVEITVYDLIGNRLASINNGITSTGGNIYSWNAAGLLSGNYYCIISVNGMKSVEKIQLIK
jgi:hypothetical protein